MIVFTVIGVWVVAGFLVLCAWNLVKRRVQS